MSSESDAQVADLESQLSALMPDAVVTLTGVVSAGATRQTLLVDIARGLETTPAIAQISGAKLGNRSLTAEDEAQVVRAAGAAGVPVAAPIAVSNDFDRDGRSVLITQRIEGVSIPRHVLRVTQDNGSGPALTEQCGLAMASVHAVPLDQLPKVMERPNVADIHQSYTTTLQDWLEDLPHPEPTLRYGIGWLRANLPSRPSMPTLVHGDFRNGNLLVDGTELAAVIDWELAHLGDPMEDLAWICLRTWRFKADHLAVGGFGEEPALRSAYEAGGGVWRTDAFHWWTVARTIWWGIGLAAQAAAFSAGLSPSIVHAASGRRVVELEYDLLNLIRPI